MPWQFFGPEPGGLPKIVASRVFFEQGFAGLRPCRTKNSFRGALDHRLKKKKKNKPPPPS